MGMERKEEGIGIKIEVDGVGEGAGRKNGGKRRKRRKGFRWIQGKGGGRVKEGR